jgi:hypothetical protein
VRYRFSTTTTVTTNNSSNRTQGLTWLQVIIIASIPAICTLLALVLIGRPAQPVAALSVTNTWNGAALAVRCAGFTSGDTVLIFITPSLAQIETHREPIDALPVATQGTCDSGYKLVDASIATSGGWVLVAQSLRTQARATTTFAGLPPTPTPQPTAQLQQVAAPPQALPSSTPELAKTAVPLIDNSTPCNARPAKTGLWCVEFYPSRDQEGNPVWVEEVSVLNYKFGRGAPRPGVPPDNFRIVAQGDFYFPTLDSYAFMLRVDGGARVKVNNGLVIDEWQMWQQRTRTVRLPMLKNAHRLQVEYYDNKGSASLGLHWEVDHDKHHYWFGRYYNTPSLEGWPVMIREDPQLNFNWDVASPDVGNGVNPDNFSVQWIRIIHVPKSGATCRLLADDKARVYVDGRLVPELNGWDAPVSPERVATLTAGRHFVEVHYAELGGVANVQFGCTSDIP